MPPFNTACRAGCFRRRRTRYRLHSPQRSGALCPGATGENEIALATLGLLLSRRNGAKPQADPYSPWNNTNSFRLNAPARETLRFVLDQQPVDVAVKHEPDGFHWRSARGQSALMAASHKTAHCGRPSMAGKGSAVSLPAITATRFSGWRALSHQPARPRRYSGYFHPYRRSGSPDARRHPRHSKQAGRSG